MFQCELSNLGKGQLTELIDKFGNLFTSSQENLGALKLFSMKLWGKEVQSENPAAEILRKGRVALQKWLDW